MPSYKQFVDQENHKKVNHIIEPLPYYVKDFFNHIHNTSSRTRLAYAYNIRHFLRWLVENNPEIKELKDISIDVMDALRVPDIDEYLATYSVENTPAGLAQKMSALNNLFSYLANTKAIQINPMIGTNRVKVESKPILRLENTQVEQLLNTIEYGERVEMRRNTA